LNSTMRLRGGLLPIVTGDHDLIADELIGFAS